MASALFENLQAFLRGRILVDEPLSRHTTWRVGGPADLFIVPADREDLRECLRLLHESGVPWLVIGSGSNLLVRDGGFRGAVIHTGALRGMEHPGAEEILVEGGLPLMTLIRAAVRTGLSGLESLAGIPGTVGGGLAMNAGAGGQQLADVVRSVTLAGPDGEESWGTSRLEFGYRRSNLPLDSVIVAARLRFRPAEPLVLEEKIRRGLAHRRAAHAVGAPSAGSVFKNPVGFLAWRLIDQAGMRGASAGGAAVSDKHANFIVNRGDAKASDILTLIERTQKAVIKHCGISLETEVRIIGEDRWPFDTFNVRPRAERPDHRNSRN